MSDAIETFPRGGTLTDLRAAALLERACCEDHDLPVAHEFRREFFLLLAAIRRRDRYEIAQRGQRLNALLGQYDRHLRQTGARVRPVSFEDDAESETPAPCGAGALKT